MIEEKITYIYLHMNAIPMKKLMSHFLRCLTVAVFVAFTLSSSGTYLWKGILDSG